MSLIDLASLVLAPTATKEGKVYSAIPDTGEGDMTFSRGSSATRVNSEGLIEKERGNLLLQSNTFDTTWTTTNANITGGQTGYDNNSDAWLFQSTSTLCRLNQNLSFTSIVTISLYAKSGTSSFLFLEYLGTVSQTWFNLTTGNIATTSNIIDANMQSIGNGWYRCSMTYNQSAVGELRIRMSDYDNSNVTTSSSTIYIQDAMLNEGLVATDVIETTTTAVYEGITDNVPRVDYSGGGCPSLLLEPSRTQLLPQSEYANSSDWNNGGTTYENNAATSPEGVDNAIKVIEDTSTAFHYLGSQKTGVSTAGDYTISGFIKKGSRRYAGLRGVTNGFVNRYFVLVDLDNGSVVDTNTFGSGVTWSHNVSEYANGWYRIEITGGHTSGTIDATFGLSDSDSPSYTGGLPVYNGVSGEHIFCYGIMIEAGSYVSSYINSYGTSTTRVADSCSKTGISELIGQTEGTLFWDLETTNTDLYKRLSLNDGSTTNWIFVGIELATGVCRGYVKDSGVVQVSVTGTTDLTGDRIKLALAYGNNDFVLYANGSQVATDTSGTVPSCNRIDVGSQNPASDVNAQSTTKQAILFPTRLTNDQLEEITK